MRKSIFLVPLFMLFLASSAAGESKKVELTLSKAIGKAISQNSEVKMAHDDVAKAKGQYSVYKSYILPKISNTTLLIPLYEDKGDPIVHTKDTDSWGPWVRTKTEIIQPLFGFGRFANYKKAAEKNILARKNQKDMKKDEIVFDVKKFYYNTQAAYGMTQELKETERKLYDVIKRVDELLKAESGEVRKQDAYKLKTLYHELKKNSELAKKSISLAKAALGFKTGFAENVDVTISDKVLKRETFAIRSLSDYQAMALKNRPEYKALNAGISARKALVTAEQKGRFPVFFIGGLIDINATTEKIRNKQGSPYAYDPFNGSSVGAGLGMKWNLDFWKVNAKARVLKAEYHKLVHQKELADRGLPIEVKKAYLEYKEALNNITHSANQLSNAKKWFLQSVMAWGLGVGDAREVLESVIFKGIADKNRYDALMNHNIAIASLSRATGVEQLKHLKY